jgi:hypothetical protein
MTQKVLQSTNFIPNVSEKCIRNTVNENEWVPAYYSGFILWIQKIKSSYSAVFVMSTASVNKSSVH